MAPPKIGPKPATVVSPKKACTEAFDVITNIVFKKPEGIAPEAAKALEKAQKAFVQKQKKSFFTKCEPAAKKVVVGEPKATSEAVAKAMLVLTPLNDWVKLTSEQWDLLAEGRYGLPPKEDEKKDEKKADTGAPGGTEGTAGASGVGGEKSGDTPPPLEKETGRKLRYYAQLGFGGWIQNAGYSVNSKDPAERYDEGSGFPDIEFGIITRRKAGALGWQWRTGLRFEYTPLTTDAASGDYSITAVGPTAGGQLNWRLNEDIEVVAGPSVGILLGAIKSHNPIDVGISGKKYDVSDAETALIVSGTLSAGFELPTVFPEVLGWEATLAVRYGIGADLFPLRSTKEYRERGTGVDRVVEIGQRSPVLGLHQFVVEAQF